MDITAQLGLKEGKIIIFPDGKGESDSTNGDQYA